MPKRPGNPETARRFPLLVPVLLMLFSLLSCDGGGEKSEWTALFYFDGDNNLAEYVYHDLNELERVGSTPEVRLAVQIDLPQPGEFGFTTTRRLEVGRDNIWEVLSSTVLEDLGEADMAHPDTLADFIRWGRSTFPARRYVLFLWDHGDSWNNESRAAWFRPRAIFTDTDNGSSYMKNHQLREALEDGGVRFDLIAIDACSMASIETAYELKDRGEILLASQELMQNNGLPYQDIFAALAENPAAGPEELARTIVDAYERYCEEEHIHYDPDRDQTYAAISLGDDIEALAQEVDRIASGLTGSLDSRLEEISLAREGAEEFDQLLKPDFYIDLYDLVSRLGLSAEDFDSFAEAFSRTVVYEYHGMDHPGSHGISIVFPLTPGEESNYDPTYADYDPVSGAGSPSLFMDLSWDNFLAEYYEASGW